MQIVDPAARPLAEALALAPAVLDLARGGDAAITASLVSGPAVVLGALQIAGRVVDLAACATVGTPVLRRCTTGTAVYIGSQAIVWTLALPHVAALHPDATARTLLNRNVRGFLAGLSRGGAPARYFGREWIAVDHRPAALLGVGALADGRIVIEVFAGLDATIALPRALSADAERAVDRWRGKEPLALGATDPEALARRVIEAVAARAGSPSARAVVPIDLPIAAPITDPRDPLPHGLTLAASARAPIGWIDAAVAAAPSRLWIGGDALVAAFAVTALAGALARGESPAPGDAPIDGASWNDFVDVGRAALARDGEA
ncbi:MAG: hypothetical protein ABJE95_03260 [Byssovorax sp.]